MFSRKCLVNLRFGGSGTHLLYHGTSLQHLFLSTHLVQFALRLFSGHTMSTNAVCWAQMWDTVCCESYSFWLYLKGFLLTNKPWCNYRKQRLIIFSYNHFSACEQKSVCFIIVVCYNAWFYKLIFEVLTWIAWKTAKLILTCYSGRISNNFWNGLTYTSAILYCIYKAIFLPLCRIRIYC